MTVAWPLPLPSIPGLETTLTIAFLDENGLEQYTIARCTRRFDEGVGPEKTRTAMERFYTDLGYTLLSVQVSRESNYPMAHMATPPKLTLLQGGTAAVVTVVDE